AEMAQWRRKIGDFTARRETNATEADQAVKREIERAFTHVEEASSKLDAAGDDGYEDAKAAYERASRDLEATWAQGRSGEELSQRRDGIWKLVPALNSCRAMSSLSLLRTKLVRAPDRNGDFPRRQFPRLPLA